MAGGDGVFASIAGPVLYALLQDDDDGEGRGAPPGSPPTQKFQGPWFSTQLILSLSIGLSSFLLFCTLRTRWEIVYMGRTKLKDFSPSPAHAPDANRGTFFGWILPTLRTSEYTVLQTVGLDAAVLLNFYRMCFLLFVLLAFLASIVLMPLNLFRHGSTDSPYDPTPNTTMSFQPDPMFILPSNSTVPSSSLSMYDYLLDPQTSATINMLFAYIFTALTLTFLYRNCRKFVKSRQAFALHLVHSISARTVLVTNLPRHLRGDVTLAHYFENCGWQVESVSVCREVEPLRRILERRTNALMKLERAWAEWVGNPANVDGYDPNVYEVVKKKTITNRITASPKQAAAEPLIPGLDAPDDPPRAQAEQTGEVITRQNGGHQSDPHQDEEEDMPHMHCHPTKSRPTLRPRWFGAKVDAIQFWERKFRKADEDLKETRKRGRFEATQSAFVTFERVQDAQTACQVVHFPHQSEVLTSAAPEPRDVVWSMVSISPRESLIREVVVMGAMVLLLLSWTPPVTTLASLLSYKEIQKALPWLARLLDRSPRLAAIVQNSLPSLGIISFNGILPFLLGWLSYQQGWKSRSAIEYSLLRKYHLFLLFTVLFIFLGTSTFWLLVREFADSPARIPEKLAKGLLGANARAFMISYVMLQAIGLMPLQLLNLGPLFTLGWERATSSKTPRECAEANAPPMLNYGWVYPQALLVFTITLVFSVVTPLILFFGALYFGVGYLVYKYKLLFIYFKPYESKGEAWRITFHRLLWAVVLFQLFMTGLFSLQNSWWLSVAMIPLILYTLWWSWSTDEDFKGLSEHLALSSICEVERGEMAESVSGMGHEGSVSRSQSNLNRRRYAVNDETMYVAPSTKRTDYSQPPMNNFFYGVLNTGRRRYAHPALTGSLPFPWLPAKASPRKFGDGAAERRGVVLSLRRKMSKKLRRSQSQLHRSDEDEATTSGSVPIPQGWTTGQTLQPPAPESGPSSPRSSGGVGEAGPDRGMSGSSMSTSANPWREPAPEERRASADAASQDKRKKRMSIDRASGIIALPEDNVWGDEDEGSSSDEGAEADVREGEGLPESPSTYFHHPDRRRTISGNEAALNRTS